MTYRRAIPVALLGIASLSTPLSAQVSRWRDPNPALQQSTVDAAAIGDVGRGFFEYSIGDEVDWNASSGLALAGGMLRASYARGHTHHIYALGYARPLTQTSLGFFGTLGTGVDLTGAFDDNTTTFYKSRAVRLAIPLSLRWGSPSRLSLAPYVAPYAELGRTEVFTLNCQPSAAGCTRPYTLAPGQTRSVGLGAGFELSAWRLAFDMGMMGVPRRLNLYGQWSASAGVRVRF